MSAPTMAAGTVTATSPLAVSFDLGGNVPNLSRDAGYTPTVGDRVYLVQVGPMWIVVGRFL